MDNHEFESCCASCGYPGDLPATFVAFARPRVNTINVCDGTFCRVHVLGVDVVYCEIQCGLCPKDDVQQ